jgi:hypothetical protein
MILKIFFGFLLVFSLETSFAQDLTADKSKIEQIIGVKGAWFQEEGVLKFTFPRTDVKVVVDEWPLPPFMGLASWISFMTMDDSLMIMGDLLLFEDEVNSVMKIATTNGLSVTALHNHFFFDHPKVFFMHIVGKGDSETLATAAKRSFDQIKSIRTKNPSPVDGFTGRSISSKNSINKEIIQNILGVDCQAQDGMVKAVIEKTIQKTVMISKNMGANSWAAFGGTETLAVVDGDIAVFEDELQDVLKTLQNANINIVAIHNHMTHEEPRVLFLHFWGKGNAKDLAKGIKAALSIIGS